MHMLIIGAWPEFAGHLVGLPIRVTLFQLPNEASEHESDFVYRYHLVDYRKADNALTAARRLHACDPFDAVLGLREFALPAVAAIAQSLSLPSLPAPASTLGRDKASVRRILNDGGCRTLDFRRCDSPMDILNFANDVGYPVIVKPTRGSASDGVHTVDSPRQVATAWEHATGAARVPCVLVEEFLIGPEYSVETRTVDGRHEAIAVTEKITTGTPHKVELGHVMPARLNDRTARELIAEAIRGLHAIGHHLGPSHVELINTAAGPTIVEINRRIGGDRIWEMLMLTAGRNLIRESLLDLVGPSRPLPGPNVHSGSAAIRMIAADRPSRLADPLPERVASDIVGIIREHLFVSDPGEVVYPPRSSDDRLGYVLAHADTPDEADFVARAAHQRLVTQLLPDRTPSSLERVRA